MTPLSESPAPLNEEEIAAITTDVSHGSLFEPKVVSRLLATISSLRKEKEEAVKLRSRVWQAVEKYGGESMADLVIAELGPPPKARASLNQMGDEG